MKKIERAWLTFLSSNNYYILMLLSLYKDLLDTNTKYPLYCGLTESVTEETEKILSTVGINVFRLNTTALSKDVLKNIKSKVCEHYFNAFTKLMLFSTDVEKMFDKVVYLDADLQVLANIDELMDCPHMSAVQDRAPGAVDKETKYILGCSRFCSGLFVWDFKNNPGVGQHIINSLPDLDPKIGWHDQSVLSYFYKDWINQKELHLDPTYGLMNFKKNFDIFKQQNKKPKIIHYVGRVRNGWPFRYEVVVQEKDWTNHKLNFKEWVGNIAKHVSYFNRKYDLHLTIPNVNNIHLVTYEEYKQIRADGRSDCFLYF